MKNLNKNSFYTLSFSGSRMSMTKRSNKRKTISLYILRSLKISESKLSFKSFQRNLLKLIEITEITD